MSDLSGWHDVGLMIHAPNIALPDLPDLPERLKTWGHQRIKFTVDEIYPDALYWFFYRDVDLASFEWSDEMRKLPGQFDDRPFFGDSRARRIISEALAGQW